ncbi:hypothetical protein ES703_88993 [subsurface metagenome]
MSEVDEEVYTTIFNALRHGVRRRILRMLSETHMSFTAINYKLYISSSHLTYHLDSLKELVSKNDSGYRLSVFGRAAVDMMNGIENPLPARAGTAPFMSLEWYGAGIFSLTQDFIMYVNGFHRTGVRNTNANRIFSWYVVLSLGIMFMGVYITDNPLRGQLFRSILPLLLLAVIHSTYIGWRLNNRLSSLS